MCSRSRLCNMPPTLLGIVNKWLMCVYRSLQCDQSTHMLANRLSREWAPLIVIVSCTAELVLIGSVRFLLIYF
jgi:hypothetical protein